ncbi:maleylpyruvate isomerase family mycothiol-dependent enzyme [Geodermatophilus sp. SYSU D01106]
MNRDDVHARTARNRRRLADVLEGLGPAQWEAGTLCEGWTVRVLAGHLLQPMLVGFGRFLLASLRHRGDTAATVDSLARRLARPGPAELVALLRRHAGDRVDPPRVGPMGPFAETCVHLRDLARPLGLDADVPREDWVLLLDHLVSPGVAPGLTTPARAGGLTLRATDTGWRHGTGPAVSGTVEALAMALTGRRAALVDLDGPGREVLARRL